MIKFACPGCSATFTVGDEKAGKSGKCPKCQSQFVIPTAEGDPTPAGAGAVAPPPLPSDPPSRRSSDGGPPPAPSADPNQPVEIQPCPKCSTRLSVLPSDIGFDIQCPGCETVFKALRADAPPPPDSGSKSKGSSSLVKLGSGSDKEDDTDDRPSRRRDSRRDEDDDRPSRRRSSRRDDDDDDDYDRPRRRRRGYESDLRSHRGTMVLVFGIVGIVMFCNLIGLVFSILALVFASMDLKEMDAGRMDPTGRGQTNTGRVLAIVSLCLFVVFWICYCGFFALAAGSGGLK